LIDIGAEGLNFAGDFAAGDAGKGDGDGKGAGFAPEIEAVQAASADADAHFVGGGDRVRDFAIRQGSRTAVGKYLNRLHGLYLRGWKGAGQALSPGGGVSGERGAKAGQHGGGNRVVIALVKKITNWLAAVFGHA
jgi:hypothetical protein